MKWIMASLLSILIVVPVFTQNANIFNDIDSLLLQGDLAGAKIKLDDIGSRHLASDLGSDGPHRYLEYGRVYDVLFFAAAFRNEYKRFQESSMATEDMTSLNASSSKLNSAWASLTALTHLSISNPLRDQLNTIPKEANSDLADAKKSIEAAQAKGIADQKAEEERQAQEEQAAAERQQAAVAAQQQTEEEQQRAEQEAHASRLEKIDAAAKKAGYAGLNKTFGLARFLNDAQRNGSLKAGLNQVFWTKLSPADEALDSLWQMDQVLDDHGVQWEIYSFNQGGSYFRIAVKAKDEMPMEGQRLLGQFYVFKGNKQFVLLANGASIPLQVFEPVRMETGE
ncbi:MAG: hypothetical protein ACLQCB_21605 [Spirochaetia bacterium]